MTLQYIYDETTSPPTQSILQYEVDPDTLYVSTDTEEMMVNLTITVYNPTQATVNCQNFQFGISVGTDNSNQLASTDSGIELTTSQSQWDTTATVIKQGDLYWYTANPAQGAASAPLAASESFVFQLTSIAVNEVEGATQFVILEVTDADPDGVQGSLALTKEQSTVLIVPGSFTVTPPTPVSPGTQVNLSWEIGDAAEYWLLYNTTLDQQLYDSRKDSPPQTSWQDAPQANTTYELIVYAGQMFTTAYAVAQVARPRFIGEPTASPQSVDSGAASTISWQTADTQYVVVTADGGYTSGEVDSSGGQGEWQVNPQLSTTYTLTPYDAGGVTGDVQYVPVAVNPPKILSFTASSQISNSSEQVFLSWKTASVVSVTLDPGGSVPFNENNHLVYPNGITTYTLTAEGQGIPAIARLLVIEQAGEFQVGSLIWSMVFDGTYLWVGNVNRNSVTRLLATDGSNQGTFPVGVSPACLAYDGTYLWVGNGGDNSIDKLLAKDGSIKATFEQLPFSPRALASDGTYLWVAYDGTTQVSRLLLKDGSNQGNFHSGNWPWYFVSDGTYMWVANKKDGTVTRLLLTDGSNQGTFKISEAAWPSALAYDGTYIWVMNWGDGTVTRLLATDGSNQGTFPVGNGPMDIVYDGTYIWVSNQQDNTLSVLLATDGSNQGTIKTVGQPQSLVYDGKYIWLVGYEYGTVVKL